MIYASGIAICVYLNWRSYLDSRCPFAECLLTYGFSFTVHEAGTISRTTVGIPFAAQFGIRVSF